jgi:2-haloacid dehalogenase
MRSYSGFLFDADNTIFDYDRAEREALTETFLEAIPRVDLETALAHYRAINAGFWRRFEQGAVSLAELKPGRFRALLDALGAAGDPAAISDRYLGRLAEKAHMVPHAREVLGWLAARASLCLVTNGLSSVQQGRLRKAGIGGMFRALLISEEIGISKPDPAFFLRAAEALSLPPRELLCVGDHPSTDIRGAMAAGIDACWYAPKGEPWPLGDPAPTFVIRDLRELEPLAPPG